MKTIFIRSTDNSICRKWKKFHPHIISVILTTKMKIWIYQKNRNSHEISSNFGALWINHFILFRFFADTSKQVSSKTNATLGGNGTSYLRQHELSPLTDDTPSDESLRKSGNGAVVLSIITSAVTLIGLCLAVAAVVARCQKRGNRRSSDIEWEKFVD